MSKIEWTEKTWNPTLGCTEVSAGCENCYAARMAYRLAHIQHAQVAADYDGLAKKLPNGKIVWTGEVHILPHRLLEPVRIKKPTLFFVDSMSDLFHESVPFITIAQAYAMMALCPQHTFQILTKRPERAVEFYTRVGEEMGMIQSFAEDLVYKHPDIFFALEKMGTKEWISNDLQQHLKDAGWYSGITYVDSGDGDVDKEPEFFYEGKIPFPNIWVGTSVEDQKAADRRIPELLKVPAAVRFLSCEPLLGPVKIPYEQLKGIDWVIAGGESGPGARPMHPDWPRTLRNHCFVVNVPFFFKQWGEYLPFCQVEGPRPWPTRSFVSPHNPAKMNEYYKAGKKLAGRTLDRKEWNEYPKAYIQKTK
jgi:protein gp37